MKILNCQYISKPCDMHTKIHHVSQKKRGYNKVVAEKNENNLVYIRDVFKECNVIFLINSPSD